MQTTFLPEVLFQGFFFSFFPKIMLEFWACGLSRVYLKHELLWFLGSKVCGTICAETFFCVCFVEEEMASLEEDMVLDGEENVGSEELLDKEIADVSVEGQSSSGEGAQSGRSLNITVKCQTLEGLEKLWQDYSSGHLNSVAEELLVTDDIKKKLGVESIKLKTVITEESYLACKRYLLNKLGEFLV